MIKYMCGGDVSRKLGTHHTTHMFSTDGRISLSFFGSSRIKLISDHFVF